MAKYSKSELIQQRLEWIQFKLNLMGWSPEEIELELKYIREKNWEKVEPGTIALLDFDTYNILK